MLYEVDPMALTSVIKANEVIDQAMNEAVDQEFGRVWNDLAQVLTDEEFIALYHAMQHLDLDQGKVVVKAGAALDALILVTTGRLNVICTQADGSPVALKVLQPGEMFGENIFEPTFWTVSWPRWSLLASQCCGARPCLSGEAFPGFENKLAGFARRFHTDSL